MGEIRAWLVESPGVWLGAYSLVFAPDETAARERAVVLLEANSLLPGRKGGVTHEDIDIRPIEWGTDFVIWNGDY